MWILPLWTRKVCPTNSGTMVQGRAQVLMGSFVPIWFCFSTLRNSLGLTKGPFFSDLPIMHPLPDLQLAVPPRAAPPHNRLGRRLSSFSRETTLGQLARGADRMAAALGAAFAAAVGMVDGIHGRAADVGAAAHPAFAAGLAQHDAHVVGVAQGADGRPAGGRHAADFSAGEVDLGPIGVAGGQGGPAPGRAAQHAAPARQHLDIVDVHPQGNLRQRQAVAHGRRRPTRRSAPGRPPSALPGPGCSASRRRHNAARRSARCGWDRIGSSLPGRRCRPCCGGSR